MPDDLAGLTIRLRAIYLVVKVFDTTLLERVLRPLSEALGVYAR